MQEDVENKTLTLVVSGTKFTGRLLKAAITKYMAYRKEVKLEKQRKREMPVAHRGKQTVKQLTQQNQGVSNIDIQDKEIRRGLCGQEGSEHIAAQVHDLLQGPRRRRHHRRLSGVHGPEAAPGDPDLRAGTAGAVQGYGPEHRGEGTKEGAGAVRQVNLKKYVLPNLPYLFVGLYATKLGQAWRLSSGMEFADKVLHLMDGFATAFQSAAPSFHPSDLLVGLCCGAGLRLAVYIKGKNAKKYRHGTEYGSARWSA